MLVLIGWSKNSSVLDINILTYSVLVSWSSEESLSHACIDSVDQDTPCHTTFPLPRNRPEQLAANACQPDSLPGVFAIHKMNRAELLAFT